MNTKLDRIREAFLGETKLDGLFNDGDVTTEMHEVCYDCIKELSIKVLDVHVKIDEDLTANITFKTCEKLEAVDALLDIDGPVTKHNIKKLNTVTELASEWQHQLELHDLIKDELLETSKFIANDIQYRDHSLYVKINDHSLQVLFAFDNNGYEIVTGIEYSDDCAANSSVIVENDKEFDKIQTVMTIVRRHMN